MLLTVAGPEALVFYKTFKYASEKMVGSVKTPAESPTDYKCVVKKCPKYYVPKKNVIYE